MINYINEEFVKSDDAKISVFDLAVLRGYGVFDFFRTYNSKPFKLKEHIQRLLNSCKIIDLKIRWELNELEKIVLKTLEKNIRENPCSNHNNPRKSTLSELNIRIAITGGESNDSITPQNPQLIVLITPATVYPEKFYKNGVKIISWPSERILPEAKSTAYLMAIKGLMFAKKKGAIEILYIEKNGKILECATSNFFAVKNEKLYTPKLDGILSGITRKVIIDLAKKLKIPVFEKNIFYKDIRYFNECFITASNKEIMPVNQIDNFKISAPGKITKILAEEFKKLTLNF